MLELVEKTYEQSFHSKAWSSNWTDSLYDEEKVKIECKAHDLIEGRCTNQSRCTELCQRLKQINIIKKIQVLIITFLWT